jgi:hypothetical protein
MPRSKAVVESDRKYYELNRDAILARKRLAGKNYREHKKANETPDLRLKRLEHDKKLRAALNVRKNQAKLTESEGTLLPASAFHLTPKAFDTLLANARTAAARLEPAQNTITIVDGGGEARPVL